EFPFLQGCWLLALGEWQGQSRRPYTTIVSLGFLLSVPFTMRVLYIGIMLEEADHSQVVRDSLRGVCASLRGLIFPLYYAIMDPPESEIGGLYGFACVIWFVTFIVVFMSAPAYCFFTVIPAYILQ